LGEFDAPPATPEWAGGHSRPGLGAALGRRVLVLLAVGTFFVSLAAGSLWSWRTFADSQGFADVTTDMLRDPAVRSWVAGQIADRLAEESLTARITHAGRPLLENVVATVVGTDEFQIVFHDAVRELHTSIVEGSRSRLEVKVDDARPLVKDLLKDSDPDLAASIPEVPLDLGVELSEGTPLDLVLQIASLAGWLALPFAAIGFGCYVVAVILSTDRRRAIEGIGWCLLGLGIVLEVVLHIVGGVVDRQGSDEQQGYVLRAVFWSLTNLLSIQAAIAVTGGAVLVIAGAYAGTGQLRARALDAWQAMWNRLEQPGWKGAASFVLIGFAIIAMVWPAAVAAVAMRVLAFVAFVAGAVGLLDLLGSREWNFGSPAVRQSARRFAMISFGVVAATCALLFFGGLSFARAIQSQSPRVQSMVEAGCNGHDELCDKPVDEVVFAGTHNAMSAPARGMWFTRQSSSITSQLLQGIRAVLIDLYPGHERNGVVRTDLPATDQATREAKLTEEEQAEVNNVLGVLSGTGSGDPDLFLCHLRCELGAVDAVDTFRQIDDFLRQKPNEVILIVIEDHVSPELAVKGLERSGLSDRAYAWEPGTPLPTLREMIEEQRNVLIMAENGGSDAPPWYHAAYDTLLQETRFDFSSIDEFSCTPNRGGSDHPLLLVNHWLTAEGAADPVEAEEANSAQVLRGRAEECRAERHLPNIIAVDYFERGDLLEVVHELNGVGEDKDIFQAGAER
jgi:hypothetical protein